MKNDAEMKFVVPSGWVVKEKVMADGSREFTIKPGVVKTEDYTKVGTVTADEVDFYKENGIFKKVPASELSINDSFLNYTPRTKREISIMKKIKKVIEVGVSDFWRPVYDPYFDANGRICYAPHKAPGVRRSYNWWAKNAKDFWTERGSRIGTRSEYIAFLAVLIKELVNSGKSVEWAWDAVCNDSKELGHYWNSKDAKRHLEETGSREVCGWYDLGNTGKALTVDTRGGLWIAGGCFGWTGEQRPLALLMSANDRESATYYVDFSGWLVLDSFPEC